MSPAVVPTVRRMAPLIVLLVASAALVLSRGAGRPAKGDEEVFVQAAYLMRTEHLDANHAVAKAAQNEYAWVTPEVAARVRSKGDIQTYALLHLWRHAHDFHRAPSPWGSRLYAESRTLSQLSELWFLATVFVLYWAVLPLGRGVALASALLLALGHPFRHGPLLFDPWVMPGAVAAIGLWLRDRHVAASAVAVAITLVKPNYVFLLPAFLLAALVRPGHGDPEGRTAGAAVIAPVAGGALVVASYLVLAASHVIWLGGYEEGVRAGYNPAVLAYSLLETSSFTYRATSSGLRSHWPVYPWTFFSLATLAVFARRVVNRARLPRTAVLLAALVVVPVVADFMVIHTVAAYRAGGHFRWINVSIIAMAIALPVAYREAARLLAERTVPARRQALATS